LTNTTAGDTSLATAENARPVSLSFSVAGFAGAASFTVYHGFCAAVVSPTLRPAKNVTAEMAAMPNAVMPSIRQESSLPFWGLDWEQLLSMVISFLEASPARLVLVCRETFPRQLHRNSNDIETATTSKQQRHRNSNDIETIV
jgi:hypothetical protein